MSVAAEAYRTLRANLIYALVDNPPKVIVLTSPGPQEGKSTTCANLGIVLAQADKRTLIIDCDLRKPVVHKVFGMRNIHGVVDVLAEQRRVEEIWQEPLLGLMVLPVGPLPPNPAELLSSRRFADFLAGVRQQFDYVLIDAPPIGLVSDPAVLATQGDGVLLVLDAQKTRKAALRESMRSLEAVGANVLGTVMNNIKKGKGGYYGYKYE
jgi:receptor protein-tyrosine kinase